MEGTSCNIPIRDWTQLLQENRGLHGAGYLWLLLPILGGEVGQDHCETAREFLKPR